MPKLFNQYQSRFVGIDYRPTAIYLLEFDDSDSGVFVKQGAYIASTDIKDKWLKKAPAKIPQTLGKSAVAIKGAEVFADYLSVPFNSSQDQIEIAVHHQAASLLSELSEEYYLDFHRLEEVEKDEGLQSIFWVAVRRAQVDRLLGSLKSLNIPAEIVDVDYLALHRAISLLSDQLPYNIQHSTTALLNLDRDYTTFIVVSGDKLIYTRSEYQDNSILFTGASLCVRVNQFLDYYYACATESSLCDQIILSGDTMILPQLEETIKDLLPLPVIVANPFLNLDFVADVDADFLIATGPAFMRCSGLALRKYADELH